MIIAALLLATAPPPDAATDQVLRARFEEVLRTYWMIEASSSCLDGELAARFAAANVARKKVVTRYYEQAEKRGTWSPPPVFPHRTFPCDQAGAHLSKYEAQIDEFETSVGEE